MKKFQSFYLILTFLSLIPHSLFSMELRYQQPLQPDKHLKLHKVIEGAILRFNQKNNLSHASKPEIFQSKGFYIQTHDNPNAALAVFKIAHVSKLSPISSQEANKAHQLLKVYYIKIKDGICSVMFHCLNRQLLPITKEQAAFLLATPLLREAVRTNELVSPDFLNPEQKQILSCSHPKHSELIIFQRKDLKSSLESEKLVKIFKIESGFASSTQSTQAVNALNHLLQLYHGSNAEQKAALFVKSKLQIDTVCDYALHEGFALGTIIQTDADPKKIEAIQVGDFVLSQDLAHDIQLMCPVTNIVKELIPSYVEIVLEHEMIVTALGQKFYLKTLNDFVTAQELIQSPELQAQFPEAILEIRQVNESIEVYKLTVAHEHNFYVTEKQLLVHNMNPELIFKTFEVGANFFSAYIIPAAQAAAPVVGPAIGGWVATHIIKGFMGKKQGDIDRDYPFGKHDQQDKKDKKDKHHTHKNKHKHHKHKKKSKEKGSEPKQSAGLGETKGHNGPPEQKQCNHSDETPKYMGCGNNAGPKNQNGLPEQKQCTYSDENPKHMGCGNAESKNQYDPDQQKPCNHSKGSQTSFEHNKDYKKDDEKTDSKSGSEISPKEDIILTRDNNKQKKDKKDKEKKKTDEKEKPKDEGKKSDKKPGEKDQGTEHPNGTYEGAPYHNQNSKGDKSPAPKNGQKALDESIPLDKTGNTPRRLGIEGEDFVVLDQTSKGKFHGHTRTWDELLEPMKQRLIEEGFVNRKGKIIK